MQDQIGNFPQGQFVAVWNDRVVGYSACFRTSERAAFTDHNWFEITGGGRASRHDPQGDWLYGMEVCVHPSVRGHGIGRALYDARKILCRRLGLDGIVICGRLAGLSRHWDACGSAAAYLEKIASGELSDMAHSFQLANGFRIVGLLEKYLPFDQESRGCAALMVWRNPERID